MKRALLYTPLLRSDPFSPLKDVRMKGIINLRGYRIIVDESIHSSKYCFKAQHDRERTFYFYTDSQESMRKWVNVLMKTTIARDISCKYWFKSFLFLN